MQTSTPLQVLRRLPFLTNFAVEAGYTELGKVTRTVCYGVTVDAHCTARGFELVAVAMFPVYRELSIYGKLGAFRAKTDITATGTVPGFRRTISTNDHSTDLTFGAGLKYAFTPNVGARLEWQRYQKVGGDNTGSENIDLWSLGCSTTLASLREAGRRHVAETCLPPPGRMR